MAKKVTFTLDEPTLERLATTAERLGKPKSEVVREAIAEYHERAGRLSESERRRLLAALDRGLARIEPRPEREVAAEIDAIRTARRSGRRSGR